MFEPYPPFETSLNKLVPAVDYQRNLDWTPTLDNPASTELAVNRLLLPDLARSVFNHSRFGSVRFADGDGLIIQSRSQCPLSSHSRYREQLASTSGAVVIRGW